MPRAGGGAAQHRGSVHASHPAAPGSILGVPEEILSLDVAEIRGRPCSAVQKLNKSDWTHLVLQKMALTNGYDSYPSFKFKVWLHYYFYPHKTKKGLKHFQVQI